ncbi:MAG: sulfur carrier protein ThiS [Deferribacteraceae bacterium]|jgi:sulfur carrier protein|nr:sulfur carrier protein ThiS [Deferribacteraceae bacterium]
MNLLINGEKKTFADGINIAQLLKVEDVESPDMVSVQFNGEFLKRHEYDAAYPKDNDEVNFLYFMGGG